MSIKQLSTGQTIDNYKNFRPDSNISSAMNIELKTFNNNTAIQTLLSNLRPESPHTYQALKTLGIHPNELSIKKTTKTTNPVKTIRFEQKNTRLLKTLKEVFKKRKEIKAKNCKSPDKTMGLESSEVGNYFRKRFYSPQETTKNNEIENLCEIEQTLEKIQKKQSNFLDKIGKKIDFFTLQERKIKDYSQKQDIQAEKLQNLRLSIENHWIKQKKSRTKAFETKKTLMTRMRDELNNSLRQISSGIQKKEESSETLRRNYLEQRDKKIREHRKQEEERRERVLDFQREIEIDLMEKGDAFLMNYEEKTRNFQRNYEERKRKIVNFKRNARSSDGIERKQKKNSDILKKEEKTSEKNSDVEGDKTSAKKEKIIFRPGMLRARSQDRSAEHKRRFEELKERLLFLFYFIFLHFNFFL